MRGGRRLVVYLVPVLVFSLAFNLPKFLEITADMGVDWELAHNVLYNKIYKQYMELLVTVVLPWLILVYLNIRIYLAVTDKSLRSDFIRIKIKLKSSRFIPPSFPSGWSETQRHRREKSLAIILITIVLVFLTCHSLKLYLSFYKVDIFLLISKSDATRYTRQIHVLNKTTYCGEVGLLPYHPTWMLTINNVNHLLLVTNSSSNFIIYCFMGNRSTQLSVNCNI